MFRRVLVGIGLGALLVAVPGVALGTAWPWPVEGRVALGYAQTWTDAAGRTCSHGGTDIAAPSDSRVIACAGGRVTFAGRVPVAGGGTALAVSVATPDGLRVTYLPLTTVAVASGADVSAGDAIGALASAGDGSTAAAHLHLSVHRGAAPIDPATLLGPEAATTAPAVSAKPPAVVAPVPAPAAVVPVQPAPAAMVPAQLAPAAVVPAQPAPVSVSQVVARTAPARAPVPVASPSLAGVPARSGLRILAPVELGPRLTVRIAPLPAETRLDLRAVVAQVRTVAFAGNGMAARLLLAVLAGLLLTGALRAGGHGIASVQRAEPLLAPARAARR
jgi:hypothetical protein